MHQPTRHPRPSIYYHYTVHEPWLPARYPGQSRSKVVIAGSGPAGMVTALELARHGVASVVLTAELQFSQGSRAIATHRPTPSHTGQWRGPRGGPGRWRGRWRRS